MESQINENYCLRNQDKEKEVKLMINFKHLEEMNQTYWAHGTNAMSNLPKALWVSVLSGWMVPVIIIHSIFPFLLNNTIGKWYRYLHKL